MAAQGSAAALIDKCHNVFCTNQDNILQFKNDFKTSFIDTLGIQALEDKQLLLDGAPGYYFMQGNDGITLDPNKPLDKQDIALISASANGQFIVYNSKAGKKLFLKVREPFELDHTRYLHMGLSRYHQTDPIEIDAINQRFLTILITEPTSPLKNTMMVPKYICSFPILVKKVISPAQYAIDPLFQRSGMSLKNVGQQHFRKSYPIYSQSLPGVHEDLRFDFTPMQSIVTEAMNPFYSFDDFINNVACICSDSPQYQSLHANAIKNINAKLNINVAPNDLPIFMLSQTNKAISDFFKNLILLGKYGFCHNDLHLSNICVTTYSGKLSLTLLDYGRSKFSERALVQHGRFQTYLNIIKSECIKNDLAKVNINASGDYVEYKRQKHHNNEFAFVTEELLTASLNPIQQDQDLMNAMYNADSCGIGLTIEDLDWLYTQSIPWAGAMYDIMSMSLCMIKKLYILASNNAAIQNTIDFFDFGLIHCEDIHLSPLSLKMYIPKDHNTLFTMHGHMKEWKCRTVSNPSSSLTIQDHYLMLLVTLAPGLLWFATLVLAHSKIVPYTVVKRQFKGIAVNNTPMYIECYYLNLQDVLQLVYWHAGCQANRDGLQKMKTNSHETALILHAKIMMSNQGFCKSTSSFASTMNGGKKSNKRGGDPSFTEWGCESSVTESSITTKQVEDASVLMRDYEAFYNKKQELVPKNCNKL